jgi:hypothetical protein
LPWGVPVALVAGSILIGASIVGSTVLSIYLASPIDPYELVVGSNKDGMLGWRLNKRTGEIVVCELAPNPFAMQKNDVFAGIPEVERDFNRPVDKLIVQCGHEVMRRK